MEEWCNGHTTREQSSTNSSPGRETHTWPPLIKLKLLLTCSNGINFPGDEMCDLCFDLGAFCNEPDASLIISLSTFWILLRGASFAEIFSYLLPFLGIGIVWIRASFAPRCNKYYDQHSVLALFFLRSGVPLCLWLVCLWDILLLL